MGDAGHGESCRRGRRVYRGCDRRLVGRTIGRLSLVNNVREA